MTNFYSLRFFLSSLCMMFLLTGCAQTSLQGEKSGFGFAQAYNSPTLPMPAPPLQSSATDGAKWGAMAYTDNITVLNDPEIPFLLGIGIVDNYATAQEAQEAAMLICESDGIAGCKPRVSFQSQCLALAYDHTNLVYAWHVATTKDEADQQAQQVCEQQVDDNACKPFGTVCPAPAGSPVQAPFTQTHPADAALLAHNLAVFARHVAILRDQGISREELSQKYEDGDEDSGEAALNVLYLQEIQMVYGPFRDFSPENIYRTQMFSHLYDMSH